MVELSAEGTYYLQVAVTADVDPTGDQVEFAFLQDGAPTASTTWTGGEWKTGAATPTAQILLGPAGTVLARGTWTVWVRVTDHPEVPVLLAGPISII